MKINIRFTFYIFLFIYKSIYCQPNQTIPVIECLSDFPISFPNGNNLYFYCDENINGNNIIRAIPVVFNFQIPYVKNYNQSSYDLIWDDEFNSGI
jgi:hypothetical protein